MGFTSWDGYNPFKPLGFSQNLKTNPLLAHRQKQFSAQRVVFRLCLRSLTSLSQNENSVCHAHCVKLCDCTDSHS